MSNSSKKFSLLRRDIVDRNGELISRNITYHAALNPKPSNKDNLLIKLRLIFLISVKEMKKLLKEIIFI